MRAVGGLGGVLALHSLAPFRRIGTNRVGLPPFGAVGDVLDVGILGVAYRRRYQTDSERVVRASATFSGGWARLAPTSTKGLFRIMNPSP